MFVYIFLVFAIVCLVYPDSFLPKKDKRLYTICQGFAIFIITVFSVIRYDIGFDYQTYFNFIESGNEERIEKFEPLSYCLMYLARMTEYPPMVFILFGVLTYWFMYKGIAKNSVNFGLSIVIYISLFYLFSLGAIRQALAMSVCIFNYTYLRERKWKAFVFYAIIATLIHYSGAISFFIYPIYHRLKFKYLIIGSILFFILKEVVVYLIQTYTVYGAYLEDDSAASGGRLKQVFYLFIFFSIFFIIKNKNFTIEETKLLKLGYLSLLFPLYFGTAVGDRVSNNLYIYYCFLLPLLLQNKFRYKRIIYNTVFIFYFLFYIFYTSYGTGNVAAYLPYKTIFTSYGDSFKQYDHD